KLDWIDTNSVCGSLADGVRILLAECEQHSSHSFSALVLGDWRAVLQDPVDECRYDLHDACELPRIEVDNATLWDLFELAREHGEKGRFPRPPPAEHSERIGKPAALDSMHEPHPHLRYEFRSGFEDVVIWHVALEPRRSRYRFCLSAAAHLRLPYRSELLLPPQWVL